MPNADYLTIAAASRLLCESRWTTRRRIKRKDLPAIKTGENTSAWLIPAEAVQRILDEREVAA